MSPLDKRIQAAKDSWLGVSRTYQLTLNRKPEDSEVLLKLAYWLMVVEDTDTGTEYERLWVMEELDRIEKALEELPYKAF